MRLARRFPFFILAVLMLIGAVAFWSSCGSDHATVTRSTFDMVVFTGDSLTAGYQNGSLWQAQQPNGYAALIAKQGNFNFIQPLVADPGVPAALELVSIGPPPVVQEMAGTSTGRVNQLMWPTDLAVPGHMLTDLISRVPVIPPATGEDIMTDIVLAYPPGNTGSQMQQAIADDPTLLFVWIGNNDALNADFAGSPAVMTSTSDFTTQFTQLMTTLQSQTSAKLVVGNIPDVTSVPYLTPAPVIIAEAAAAMHITTAQASAALGIVPGDYVNATGLAELESILAGSPNHALPLVDAEVLTAAEAAQVQAQVDAYNTVIASQVQAVGGTLVDIHAVFVGLGDCRIPGIPNCGGVTINGVTATNAFLGGLFSLDGIHPTNTGYAIVANAFIDTMNVSLGTTVPDVDVASIATTDPLFPPNITPVGGGTNRISLQTARRAEQVLRRK